MAFFSAASLDPIEYNNCFVTVACILLCDGEQVQKANPCIPGIET